VAFCLSNKLHAVVLDSQFVIDGWSAKMVKPKLPVLLLLLGWQEDKKIPDGVDAVAGTHSKLLGKLEKLLGGAE
jgi:hypothetical protein